MKHIGTKTKVLKKAVKKNIRTAKNTFIANKIESSNNKNKEVW